MPTLLHVDAPIGDVDISGVERMSEQVPDAGKMDEPRLALGEQRVVVEEVLYLALCLEAARGEAFQRFRHNTRDRLRADQKLVMAADLLEVVTGYGLEHPIAVLGAAPHPVLGLLAVLLALVLGDAGQQVLDEGAVGVLAEPDGWRHQHAARLQNGAAQRTIGLDIAGEPGQVVDDHRMGAVGNLVQKN
nr:hypothetical protein [Thalassobaculum litoreum]